MTLDPQASLSSSKPLTLPKADGSLPENPVQWWYWTLHLATPDGRRFGSELTFFAFTVESLLGQEMRNELQKKGLWEKLIVHFLDRYGFQLGQCALTDLQNGSYYHTPLLALGMPPVLKDRYSMTFTFPEKNYAKAEGGDGHDHVVVQFPEWQLDITMINDNETDPPALHYGGYRHNYSVGGYTYYYSRPRMNAQGTLVVGGEKLPVTGTAWFDRQYGDLNDVVHQGWQWFAIQLNDGTNVMLFDILNVHGEEYGAIMRGAQYTQLGPNDFTVDALSHWTSPHSGIVYPASWKLTFAGQEYMITPTVADQEFTEPAPFPTYWEGDCAVALPSGEAAGRAYIELNGFHAPSV